MRSVLVLLLSASLFFAADARQWRTGKVVDSKTAQTYFQTGSSTVSSASGTAMQTGNMTTASVRGSSDTVVHNEAVQATQLIIVGSDYAYLVNDTVERAVGPSLHGSLRRAIANRKHGCRYVIGDPIYYAQDKGTLYVLDADGKQCRLEIQRQERVNSAATAK